MKRIWSNNQSLRFALSVAVVLLLATATRSQEASKLVDSEVDLLLAAEADIQLLSSAFFSRKTDVARRAERSLEAILTRDPDTPLRLRIVEDLKPIHELLAEHNLQLAQFYLGRQHGGLKGAQSRLLEITRRYPSYSKMDEVLLNLARIAIREENPDDAVRNLWTLVCKYPASRLSPAAFDEIWRLGVSDWEGCEQLKP